MSCFVSRIDRGNNNLFLAIDRSIGGEPDAIGFIFHSGHIFDAQSSSHGPDVGASRRPFVLLLQLAPIKLATDWLLFASLRHELHG